MTDTRTLINTDALTAQGVREVPTQSSTFAPARMFTTGRDAHGRFAGWRAPKLCVTRRGHWFRSDDERDGLHNDTLCRGCGHRGHFTYILDYRPCPKPATSADISSALRAN